MTDRTEPVTARPPLLREADELLRRAHITAGQLAGAAPSDGTTIGAVRFAVDELTYAHTVHRSALAALGDLLAAERAAASRGEQPATITGPLAGELDEAAAQLRYACSRLASAVQAHAAPA